MAYYQIYSTEFHEIIFSTMEMFEAVDEYNKYRARFPDENIELRKIETIKDSRRD